MIVPMVRVRVAGPRLCVDAALRVLQDFGALHVDKPSVPISQVRDTRAQRARRRACRCLADVQAALDAVPATRRGSTQPLTAITPAVLRRARRVRRTIDRLQRATSALDDERRALVRYREFFQAFETLAGHECNWPQRQAFYVILRAGAGSALRELRGGLERALDGEVAVLDAEIGSGERAVLIIASARAASRVSALLAAARVDELPAPPGVADPDVLRALPAVTRRLDEVDRQLRAIDRDRAETAAADGPWLQGLHAFLRDEVLRLEARDHVVTSEYLFIVEGWVPATLERQLQRQLQKHLGSEIDVTVLERDTPTPGTTPVALHNPPIFRPFELVTHLLPLPKYGTIDPTPFVAVFMPAFFGLMVGDAGYGAMLLVLGGGLRRRSAPDSTLRSVAAVTLACGASTMLFGFIFGEVFGSLGEVLGLHPFFNREQATFPFLVLSVALGGVHVALGLVLGAITAWRGGDRRKAVSGGIALGMLLLTALLLFAALRVLPSALLTPLAIAILCAFAVLVALEGIVAVVELLSVFGHILSYARIMALGMASLMLAVVANDMVGALGSVLVGAVFALLFHLVNFAIALFSPTIHALRLHYVEFFGHFFTPGGAQYQPLAHWHPSPSGGGGPLT